MYVKRIISILYFFILVLCGTSFAQSRLQFKIEKVLYAVKDSAHQYKWVETDSFLNNKLITINVGKMYIVLPSMTDIHYHDSLSIVTVDNGYSEDETGATMAIFHYKDVNGDTRKYSLYYTIGDNDHKAYYTGYDEDNKTIYQYLLTWISGTVH